MERQDFLPLRWEGPLEVTLSIHQPGLLSQTKWVDLEKGAVSPLKASEGRDSVLTPFCVNTSCLRKALPLSSTSPSEK